MKLTLNSVLCRGLAAGALFGVALPAASPALAQDEEQMVEELVVVGSRRRDRSAADSPVPVDVIGGDDFRNHGDTDMDSLLASLVPSYNVDQQPISDAGTVIRPASLRGLSSDATLVLVNGKRRHRGSVISFLGGGISDGAHGPDLSAIPAVALDRVEVLRDGASAQYGSDAIAGVLNLVLREDSSGGSVEAKWGRTGEGDGEATTLAANLGLPLMDTGFVNLSMEYKQADPTSRSVQRADAAGLIAAGNNRMSASRRRRSGVRTGGPRRPTSCSPTWAWTWARAAKSTPSATGPSVPSRAASSSAIRTPGAASSAGRRWRAARRP